MDPKTDIYCIVFWAVISSTCSSSCNNIIRLSDLRNTIKNQTLQSEIQTQVIQDQRQINAEQRHFNDNLSRVIEDLRKILEDQRSVIENQTKVLQDLKKVEAEMGKGKTLCVFDNAISMYLFTTNTSQLKVILINTLTTL